MDLAALPLFFAALCAATMGFAIQRGATCMVAAIEEVIERRRATRAIALLEAAVWVAGSLVLLRLTGLSPQAPGGFAAGPLAVAGGILLGWGALFNRACMFGSIARLGSGEWGYAAVPIGFLLGCLAGADLGPSASPGAVAPIADGAFAWILLAAAGALAFWRLRHAIRAAGERGLSAHVWSPHRATLVIGVTFAALTVVAGAWTYTDWLVAVGRGARRADLAQGLLFLALLGGAILGGWSAGRLSHRRPDFDAIARSLTGGFAMGLGGLLVPGGNDGLILIGLPFLEPYALVALAAMALTIAGGLLLRRSRSSLRGAGTSA